MRVGRSVSPLMLVLWFALAGASAQAAPASDATAFVDTLVHQALQTLSDKRLALQAREQQLAHILEDNFDLGRIARFVLGRYWNTASAQEQQRFTAVFEQWVIKSYGRQLSDYSGETIKLTGMRPDSDVSFTVTSKVILSSGAPPTRVDWRVRREAGDYKIIDVDFEGVSLALTQREEFAAAIERNGGTVVGLTHALESKLSSGGDLTQSGSR